MFLDVQSENILRYIINQYNATDSINSDEIHSQFPNLSKDDIFGIINILTENGFVQSIYSDDDCDVSLLYKGKTYFETKAMELERQTQPSVSITNSSNFNVGNGNTINVTNGITADEATQLIEQSTLSDKEALKEVIALLNDSLENNKPIQPSKFKKIMACITSFAPLIQAVGGVVVSAIQK